MKFIVSQTKDVPTDKGFEKDIDVHVCPCLSDCFHGFEETGVELIEPESEDELRFRVGNEILIITAVEA